MAYTHQTSRPLDVAGAHRYMFFTSSSGGNRTKKGRQALARRIGGRPLSNNMGPPNNYGRTTDSTSSTILLKTQSSSTQTDMRDSEIQTDPWWYRSEGVPLLCCRGSHRKLERAKWNARAAQGVFDQSDEAPNITQQTDNSIISTSNDGDAADTNISTITSSTQRTVSCGPSYGSRAYFPDPLDLWVSTYQKLRLEDEIEEEKMALKRRRILRRQQLQTIKRHKQVTASSRSSKASDLPMLSNRRKNREIPKLPSQVFGLHNDGLKQALDHLCQELNRHSLNQTFSMLG